MTTLEEIDNVFIEYFKDTFDNLGLEKYESSSGPRNGGWIKFKNKAFGLQILDDIGLMETDISPLFGQEQFRGIETYHSLLTLKKSKNGLSESEKIKILGTNLDYISPSKFLTDNFDPLRILLGKDNYKTTLKEIENFRQSRFDFKLRAPKQHIIYR